MRRLRFLLVILILAACAAAAQPARSLDETGLSGSVLTPEGTPVSGGIIVLRVGSVRSTAYIDQSGRFRIVPDRSGWHELRVNAPGLAPYRVAVDVPASRTVALPEISLLPATYFRARFVSSNGEPIVGPRLRRFSHDAYGMDISDPLETAPPDRSEPDGTITIGPLPIGITRLIFDTLPWAQTRLKDVHVNGSDPLLDGGTIAIDHGATLHVDVVDVAGGPILLRDVVLEEVAPFPVIEPRLERTNKEGRATFDRLAAGRYRLRVAAGLCERRQLYITRVIAVPGSGVLGTRLIVDGRVTIRLTSPSGPLKWHDVSATPDVSSPQRPTSEVARLSGPPIGRPSVSRYAEGLPCGGKTDEDGRVTLASFPPGPAMVRVRLLTSAFIKQVNVPADGPEVTVMVPEGYLPVRVIDATTKNLVPSATITWTGGGGRVEATTTNGDALLAGVASTAGVLSVTARDYDSAEQPLEELPSTHEVVVTPQPSRAVHARVVNSKGEPIADAVLQLTPANPMEVTQIATTNAKGLYTFSATPAGSLRIVAAAREYAATRIQLPPQTRGDVVLRLKPRAADAANATAQNTPR